MVPRQIFSRGPCLSLPSQPPCAALLRDTWRWSLGCCSRLPTLRGVRDGETRMQAAACAIVISFRTEPGHIVQHLWSTVARYATEVRVWESQRNQICLVPTLIPPFCSYFGQSGVPHGDNVPSSLGSHRNMLGVCKKTISCLASRGKWEPWNIFTSRKSGERCRFLF